jgi:hypothetical protein
MVHLPAAASWRAAAQHLQQRLRDECRWQLGAWQLHTSHTRARHAAGSRVCQREGAQQHALQGAQAEQLSVRSSAACGGHRQLQRTSKPPLLLVCLEQGGSQAAIIQETGKVWIACSIKQGIIAN